LLSLPPAFLNYRLDLASHNAQVNSKEGVWVDGWMDGWMGEWMDGWTDSWMDGWMDGWMGEWMD
jgi:hypothetical protein